MFTRNKIKAELSACSKLILNVRIIDTQRLMMQAKLSVSSKLTLDVHIVDTKH